MDEEETWLSIPEVAETLQIPDRTVRQYLRDKTLVGTRRGPNGRLVIPGSFLTGTQTGDAPAVLATLPGTITVLLDAGFSDEDTVSWLLTEDDELGEAPIAALQRGHVHAVRRVAQAAGF
ncbi:MAG TPA: Rv2175c family DNA-binding protein [Ruania sp.]|nr:Rv2175c family DNA-binding protein [Ruania sp.]